LQDVYQLNIFNVMDVIMTKLGGLEKNKHVYTSITMGRINKQIILSSFVCEKSETFLDLIP
jgi:hypothetical protein